MRANIERGKVEPIPRPKQSRFQGIARGAGLFFGAFCLLNLIGSARFPSFDANLWWIDLRRFPNWVATPFLLGAGLCLVWYAVRPPRHRWGRTLIAVVIGLLVVAAFANAVEFFALLARRTLRAGMPVPLSLFIAAAFLMILFAIYRQGKTGCSDGDWRLAAAAFLACIVAFPLLQTLCFGKTDYRRPADVVVVFGARAYADGRPSDALADRVRTACLLYWEGAARKIIFSGGPGDGPINETEAMRLMALKLGVRTEDILTDPQGTNTRATVRNTAPMLSRLGATRVLAVSHFYHLPRIKMAYQRQGREVYTVPAKENYFLRETPYMMGREVAAFWSYYLQPLRT